MCRCIESDHVVAGFICCACTVYNGLQRSTCKQCGRRRCLPLRPDRDTGRQFETYQQAYADDPDTLDRVERELEKRRP